MAVEIANGLFPRLRGSRVELLGKIECHRGPGGSSPAIQKIPGLFRDDSKPHVPLDPSRFQRMASDKSAQRRRSQIAIGLASGDQAKALLPRHADPRAHKLRILEQMGDLTRMRSKREDFPTVHEARSQIRQPLPTQGSLESGSDTWVDFPHLLV